MKRFSKAIKEFRYWKESGNNPRILYNDKEQKYFVALIIPFNIEQTNWKVIHN